jgi:hypothetical protein
MAQDIMPVALTPLPHSARGVVLIGGPAHGERMQVPYPMPIIRMLAMTGELQSMGTELTANVETVNYYSLDMRDDTGDTVYASTSLMTQIVYGTVREVPEWGDAMNALLAAVARRYARMLDLLSPLMTRMAERVSEDVAHDLEAIAQSQNTPGTLDDILIYEHAHVMDARMSGKKEYPLDAVAAENKRREAALRKAADCISAIDEVTDE